MALDTTMQFRIDSRIKDQAEELYRSMGTSFAEALRIFASQSVQSGGMPFRPSLRSFDQYSEDEIKARLLESENEINSGHVYSQSDLDRAATIFN